MQTNTVSEKFSAWCAAMKAHLKTQISWILMMAAGISLIIYAVFEKIEDLGGLDPQRTSEWLLWVSHQGLEVIIPFSLVYSALCAFVFGIFYIWNTAKPIHVGK